MNHMRIDLTEAVEAAARETAKNAGLYWDELDDVMKLYFREGELISIRVAMPFIIDQVKKSLVNVIIEY